MTTQRSWPPEIRRYLNGDDPVSTRVLAQFGRMREEFPADVEVDQFSRAAAREFVDGAESSAMRNHRLELVAQALRLAAEPGMPKIVQARHFIKRESDAP